MVQLKCVREKLPKNRPRYPLLTKRFVRRNSFKAKQQSGKPETSQRRIDPWKELGQKNLISSFMLLTWYMMVVALTWHWKIKCETDNSEVKSYFDDLLPAPKQTFIDMRLQHKRKMVQSTIKNTTPTYWRISLLYNAYTWKNRIHWTSAYKFQQAVVANRTENFMNPFCYLIPCLFGMLFWRGEFRKWGYENEPSNFELDIHRH